jgi:phage gp37-like protein
VSLIADIEAAIVARLKSQLDDELLRVYTAAELAQTDEQLQVTPNCTVIYNGYRTDGSVASGIVQGVIWSWLVVVAVKSAEEAARSSGARAIGIDLVEKAMTALINFRPLDGAGSILRLADAPAASFSEAGFAYYPLIFEITRAMRGI